MTPSSNVTRRPVPTGQVVGAIAVAGLSAAAWFAWMAWDSEYQVDPVTQVASGPYETWQVVGCGVSLIVVFVAALVLRVRPVFASVALVVAFTAAWTWTASRADQTGLVGVGAIMVATGLSMATAVGSWVALVVSHRRRAVR
jgi:hypothetical protein